MRRLQDTAEVFKLAQYRMFSESNGDCIAIGIDNGELVWFSWHNETQEFAVLLLIAAELRRAESDAKFLEACLKAAPVELREELQNREEAP